MSYFRGLDLKAMPGGSPIKGASRTLLGAIGVSGLTSAEDQKINDAMPATVLAR